MIFTILAAVFSILIIFFLFIIISFSPTFAYKGKHVLCTGGSSGIGFELAKEYIRRGANVTIVARNVSKLEAAVKDLQSLCTSTNQKVNMVSVDTSSSLAAVEKAFESATQKLGDISVLVNCAGISIAGEFDVLDTSQFQHMFNCNVMGSVFPTRAVISSMKKNREGRIIFVSSQIAQAAIHGYSAYAASKWALRGFAESLQMEVKPFNIYVSVSYPPDTATPGYDVEMLTKPSITKKLCESSQVFSPSQVAKDIVNMSAKGYFGISSGFDGWLLKQLHPGMTPVNHWFETLQLILFTPIAKVISIFIVTSWDRLIKHEVNTISPQEANIYPNKKKE